MAHGRDRVAHARDAHRAGRAHALRARERAVDELAVPRVLRVVGQERVVLTKEILILRPGSAACFDPFYLLWAMSLKVVRDQWKRVVFMQTNREDVGKRYLEIRIPVPPDRQAADRVSRPFREYFRSLAAARTKLATYLHQSDAHHFFVAGAVESDGEGSR